MKPKNLFKTPKRSILAILLLTLAITLPFSTKAQPASSSGFKSQRAGSADTESIWTVDEPTVRSSESSEASSSAVKHKTYVKSTSPELATKARPAGSEGSRGDVVLPIEYRNRRFAETASVVVVPDSKLRSHLPELRPGEVLKARIPHAVIAFSDERTPVIARVTEGMLKGENLVGEARLEPNSHRIFIEMKTVTRFDETYHFKGEVTDVVGNLGLTGDYHSQEWKLFSGDFIASTVAAYFDGLVPRQPTIFGQMETDNSVDSAFKKGLAGGAMSTAERFRDKLKKTPEFCETQATDVRVIVIE